MKRMLAAIFALIPVLCFGQFRDSSYGELYESDCVQSLKEHVGYLASAALEGRGCGDEGEAYAALYIKEQFAKYGIDVLEDSMSSKFGILQESGDTLTSSNVIGVIPGYDKTLKESYIVIGARLDNLGTSVYTVDGEKREKIYYGANGNGSGLAMLLELGRMLSTNRALLRRSVLLVAFGSTLKDCAGSWYFLNRSFKAESIDAMIELEMLGIASGGFYSYTASNADLNKVINDLAGTLQPIKPSIVGIEPCGSNHRSFYAKEIPSVMFTTGMYPEYNTEKDSPGCLEYDNMERELEYLYNFTVSVVNGTKPAFRPAVAKEIKKTDSIPAYYECDRRPVFLGSSDPQVFLKKWVYTYLRYPREAVERGTQGKVLVNFDIDENGKVCNVQVVKGVDDLLDQEAVRVISASPDWKPASIKGKKVKCRVSVYVEFRLEKR